MVEPGAALRFRQRHGRQAQFRGLAESLAGETSGLVQFARQWAHFILRELAHGALQQRLFFGKREVQG
jgi:hypothetical protein